MPTPIFTGEIYKGKLTLHDKVGFMGYLTSIFGQVEVIVRRKGEKRSKKENDYYWTVVVNMIAEYTGMTDVEAHEALKWKFLQVEKKGLYTVRSTTTLTVKEMEKYLEDIRVWAAQDLGMTIPLPRQAE